ncbi:MAG: (2Fe-2S)-binding protein [Thermodesulfobacteriota bacterium]
MKKRIKLNINGDVYEMEVEDRRTLLDVLREDLSLMGTKKMCDTGQCGSCTILLGGLPVLACLILAADADGKPIQTIEGVAQGGVLDPIQGEFIEKGAIQCGFCTPGMIMTAKGLLAKNPHPSDEEIKRAIAGNLCRCTGYVRIVEAIRSAATRTKEQAL